VRCIGKCALPLLAHVRPVPLHRIVSNGWRPAKPTVGRPPPKGGPLLQNIPPKVREVPCLRAAHGEPILIRSVVRGLQVGRFFCLELLRFCAVAGSQRRRELGVVTHQCVDLAKAASKAASSPAGRGRARSLASVSEVIRTI
jgi:hypothetical protein